MKNPRSTTEQFERLLKRQTKTVWRLRLYVGGVKPKSNAALIAVKEICDLHLAGRYELEVIDLYQQPERAKADGIIAVPTLIRLEPGPTRKFIGDLSDKDRVLRGLGVGKLKETL